MNQEPCVVFLHDLHADRLSSTLPILSSIVYTLLGCILVLLADLRRSCRAGGALSATIRDPFFRVLNQSGGNGKDERIAAVRVRLPDGNWWLEAEGPSDRAQDGHETEGRKAPAAEQGVVRVARVDARSDAFLVAHRNLQVNRIAMTDRTVETPCHPKRREGSRDSSLCSE
jgi:hypothetical protein